MRNIKDLKICILGMGYIGLPTGITFARAGFKVFGFDVNKSVIDTLKTGKIHIVEPDLQEAYEEALKSGNLVPTSELVEADVYIIAVPTPFKKNENKKIADLSYVESASKMAAKVLKEGNLVILESTVPPQATKLMTDILERESGIPRAEFYTCHCPERVLPGRILHELEHNDRIIGAEQKEAGELARDIYKEIVKVGNIYLTDDITAEMCKLVENTSRDINIAFANELSMICDRLKINVFELINLANKHPRVNILTPGAGVGGHCIAVDPWFIVEKFPMEANIIREARVINDYKPQWIMEQVEKKIGEDKSKVIGILGAAYKPDIYDLRESPSLEIAVNFKEKGYKVLICEPNVAEDKIKGIDNLSLEEVLEKSDFAIITLAHTEFKNNIEKIRGKKEIFDCIGLLR